MPAVSLIYRLSQSLLAPGSQRTLSRKVKSLVGELPLARHILDVGCGPRSYLWQAGLHPVGVDILPEHVEAFKNHGEKGIVGSAEALPLPDNSFEGVWSFGLLHHLPPDAARRSVNEMIRVCCRGGYIVILDGVLPESIWRRPLAWATRKLDRGRYIRYQHDLESLLLSCHKWSSERFVYSFTGLEGLLCVCYPR